MNHFFRLDARGSSIGRELRGAIATFLTMAYILVVNPQILQIAGMNFYSSVACTALAAGVCCILMGLIANFPIALASGMGLNALVATTIATQAGTWQAAMGLIVLDGLVTALLVVAGLREAVMRAIPRDLRLAIGAGIGLFIAFIGLTNAGITVRGDPHGPLVDAGHWSNPATIVALIGLAITGVLIARKVRGALILGILITTIVGIPLGVTRGSFEFHAPSFANAFHADVLGALKLSLMPLLFAVIMVDFFDTLGTASAIAEEARLADRDGRFPGVRRVLLIDSLSAAIGGVLGASSVTSYIESAAGVAEGARTGLHSVFVGLMFLACIFLAPLAGIVPAAATAPALILVGFLMMGQIANIDFQDLDTAIPAFLTLLTIPFTYSIAHGVGYGVLAFVAIKAFTLRFGQVHPVMYVVAAAFLGYFILV
jgi:AGZA family xanthine/uracil permease-like MFS transporter